MSLPIFRYPLDKTGENPNNRVNNESHDLIPKARITDVRVFSPKYGPFYANELMEIRDAADNRILVRETDFQVNDLLQDPTLMFAQEIGQSIVIINGNVSNTVIISYQVLGGNYQNDSTAIAHAWELFMNDSRPVDWDNISNKPATFPPSLHIHLLEDVIGWGPVIVALGNIEQAITLSCVPMVEALIDWMKNRPVKWDLIYDTPTTIDGYGITDGVRKTGDTMSGDLTFAGDNRAIFDPGSLNEFSVGGSNTFYDAANPKVAHINGNNGNVGIHPRTAGAVFINNVGVDKPVMTVAPNAMTLDGNIELKNTTTEVTNERIVRFPNGMYMYGNNVGGGRVGLFSPISPSNPTGQSLFLDSAGNVNWTSIAAGNGRNITNLRWGNIIEKPTTLVGYGITDAVQDQSPDGNIVIRPTVGFGVYIGLNSPGNGGNTVAITPGVMSVDGNMGVSAAFSADSITANSIRSNGGIVAVGNVTSGASDARLKKNVTVIEDAVRKVQAIGGYVYDWDISKCSELGFMPANTREHGLIAQEVQRVMPDAVAPAPFNSEYLTVRYERIVALLAAAINEQQKQIESLQLQIKGK